MSNTTANQKIEVMDLDSIVPYWRNPRMIPDEAVNAVAESIKRYGYQQPIVVDTQGTIVIGHTRYQALRRLGVEKVAVVVADLPSEKIKQLRVLDNRTGEYTSWDFDALAAELSGMDAELLLSYFPEIGAEVTGESGVTYAASDTEPEENGDVEFICPQCFHSWTMHVDAEDIIKGRLEVPA